MSTNILDTLPIPELEVYTSKELQSDQEVRWCPGCGDYSILKQVQTIVPQLNIPKEKLVFVSGIGCSSRFPYYMNTYGFHSIHGRATAVATGLKVSRPDLEVWIITGDGDSLSIGGNHTIHLLRRNVNTSILMFNNQIYGLTKGQYSPTSKEGQLTKSSPMGVVDSPFNPIALTLGADASFVARSMDRDPKHLQTILLRAAKHKGAAFIDIYQNCNVFNDGAFFVYTDKETKPLETLFLEHGKPLLFGENNTKGIQLDGFTPRIVDLTTDNVSVNDLWIHDETDLVKANILSRFYDIPEKEGHLPRPFGVFYAKERACYEDGVHHQISVAKAKSSNDINALISGSTTWEVEE
jgi:2-oxoglutarate ferredoxin oxidoreductase subunit beta